LKLKIIAGFCLQKNITVYLTVQEIDESF
jgi:hypothetical protein